MKNFWTIAKKEFVRFFTDPKLILAIMLPGLLIYFLYFLMGNIMKVDDDYSYKVATINEPVAFTEFFENSGIKITYIDADKNKIDDIKEKIKEKEIDLLIVYSENFEEDLSKFEQPSVDIFYNSGRKESVMISQLYLNGLSTLKDNISGNIFSINMREENDLNKGSNPLSLILPMLLSTLLLSSIISIIPEAIAGERERGTISTILVSPIKRKEYALGKVFSLTIIALVGSISSIIGTICSLPQLLKMQNLDVEITQFFTFTDIIQIIIISISFVFLMASVVSLISMFGKTVKEVNNFTIPITTIVSILGLLMMVGKIPSNFIFYCIPVYSTLISLTGVLTFELTTVNLILTIVTNIIFGLIIILLIAKMYNNEKVVN